MKPRDQGHGPGSPPPTQPPDPPEEPASLRPGGEAFEDDLRVLAHLRGYPDDLRRFSNLIKQAHPRGIPAIRIVLGRPASSTSLIAAVCRYVAEGVPIVSAVEAAEILGVSPGQSLEEIAARAGFPAPLFAVEHRRLWRRADVEEYAARGQGAG